MPRSAAWVANLGASLHNRFIVRHYRYIVRALIHNYIPCCSETRMGVFNSHAIGGRSALKN